MIQLFFALSAVWLGVRIGAAVLPARDAVRLGRGLLLATPVTLLLPWSSELAPFRPPAQVFAPLPGGEGPAVGEATLHVGTAVASASWLPSIETVLVLGAVVGGLFWLRQLAGLWSTLREATVVHRLGVRVARSDEPVPYAAWLGAAYVVLPRGLHDRLALRHELVHHRHGDPIWAHLLGFVRAIGFANPLVHDLVRTLHHLEEVAVDRAVVRDADPRAYGQLLVDLAAGARRRPPLVAAMAASRLRRRVSMLFRPERSRAWTLPVALVAAALLTGSTWATSVHDARVDRAELEALVDETPGAMPAMANELVLDKLNGYVASEKGRAFSRAALARYPLHRDAIATLAREYRVPQSVAAVAFVESGFDNLDQWSFPSKEAERRARWKGAGMWMFIPSTARQYGMQVGPDVDDRLDVMQETHAAMSLLVDLRNRHGSWGLALAGYNQGSKKVEQAIEAGGTDDVWTLVDEGHLNHYVPAVAAAMLILEHPELVE